MSMPSNQDQKERSQQGRRPSDMSRSEAWTDPVCGMDLQSRSEVFTSEHEGKTYRFCSEACRSKFEQSPQQYTETGGSA